MTNRYTREDIIRILGDDKAVKALDRENCEPTNCVGYNGSCQGDEQIEWSVTVKVEHDDYEALTAYYYTNAADETRAVECDGDWGSVDFVVDHYRLY